MEKLKLKARKRDILGKKVRALRREGFMPAVLYSKGKENLALSIGQKEFNHIYKNSGGSTLINLEISDEKSKNVLVKEVARDAVKGELIHADFYEVKMTEKITAKIPLNFIGDSKAVIDLSGGLITTKSEVEIECLPADLPHEIEVDISTLEDFESVIHIKDIKVPAGVEIKDDLEETLAFVEAPRTEEEMAELEEPIAEAQMPEAEQGAQTPEEVEAEKAEAEKPEKSE